jgi:hypothetical protein
MTSAVSELLARINELVIEAAHEGSSEDEILDAVYDGLDLVFGPPEED